MLAHTTAQTMVAWLVGSALAFTIAYEPMLRMVRGLDSRYGKANVSKRLLAGMLDGIIVAAPALAAAVSGNWTYAALAASYALLRDALGGHSLGKLLTGLVVLNVTTGRPAGFTDAARRNIVFLLPGANLAALVLEARTIRRDPHGLRLGDRIAHTQVVEAAGAAQIVKELEQLLLDVGGAISHGPRPSREPIRRDHAA